MANVADIPFYVGTYGEGIFRCVLNLETGVISPPEMVASVKDPSFLALSPDGRNLYAALESSATVASWKVGDDGKLGALRTQPSHGSSPCHVAVDATGRHLFVANYGGGSVACFPVKNDGSLSSASWINQYTARGPDIRRQEGPHAHWIGPSPDGSRVYACDLGTDDVNIYRFDVATGILTPNDPPFGRVPPGSGPRHLTFSPDGRFAFTNNEMALTVTAFTLEAGSGALTELQTVSTLPPGTPKRGSSTAAIACHPNGKWLFVSNRGHDTIAVFTIAKNGTLTLIQNAPSPAFPRGFGLAPNGKWLVVGGERDDSLTALWIDQENGRLTPSTQRVHIVKPVCVEFFRP